MVVMANPPSTWGPADVGTGLHHAAGNQSSNLPKTAVGFCIESPLRHNGPGTNSELGLLEGDQNRWGAQRLDHQLVRVKYHLHCSCTVWANAHPYGTDRDYKGCPRVSHPQR
jgi:hypothetical protein